MNLFPLGASLSIACGAAVLLLGLFILREAPGDRLRQITAAMMFFGGIGPVLGGIGLLLERGGDPAALAFLRTDPVIATGYIWELFFPSLLLFTLVFPKEHVVLRRFRHLPALLYFPHLFHLVILLFFGRIGASLSGFELGAPLGIGGSVDSLFRLVGSLIGFAVRHLARFHIRFFSFIDLVYIVAAILLLYLSLRGRPAPALRRQVRAVLVGLGSCVGLYAVAVPLPTLLDLSMPGALRPILLTTALLVGTGTIGFAIVRTSFLDVETAFRRAILFSATAGALLISFFLLARELGRILTARTGVEIPLFEGLFTLLAVVFFHPILGKIEGAVDRMLAGSRAAPRRVMQDLGRELTTLFDLPSLSSKIVRSLRTGLGVDRVYLFLREEGGERFVEAGAPGRAGDRIEVGADHPLLAAIALCTDPASSGDLVEGIEDQKERGEAAELVRTLAARITVPVFLPDGGDLLGMLILGEKATGSRYRGDEVELLSMLSTQIGFAVRNARIHEEAVARRVVDEELSLARSIQESIVPRRSAGIHGLDVAAVNLPSRQVGGDYYDLIPMSDGGLGIAVGDVSGKGVPAAILMSMLHAALHVQMNGSTRVADLMSRLNQVLYQSTSIEQFATFFFGVYARDERTLRFTNGGHNFPVLLRRDGTTVNLSEGGLILGILEDAGYREGMVEVEEGDLIVFYTDGVTEEALDDDEQFGEDRLMEVVNRCREMGAAEIVDAVHSEVVRFAGRDRFADDFTLIVLRAGGGERSR